LQIVFIFVYLSCVRVSTSHLSLELNTLFCSVWGQSLCQKTASKQKYYIWMYFWHK